MNDFPLSNDVVPIHAGDDEHCSVVVDTDDNAFLPLSMRKKAVGEEYDVLTAMRIDASFDEQR